MSYILDALRKADAQRERGAARGIHAQASTLGTGEVDPVPRAAWVWVVLALVIVLGAAMAWYLARDKPANTASVAAMTAPAPVPVPAPTVASAPPAVATASVAQSVQPPPAMPAIVGAPPAGRTIPLHDPTNTSQPTRRGAQPVPGTVPEAAPSVRAADAREAAMMAQAQTQAQRSRPMPAAPQSAPVQQAPGARSMAPAAPPMTSPAPATAPAPMAAPAPAAANAPPATGLVGGLPPDAPKLSISGGVYSTNPTQRMLIVNGQVFNEGSELAPGVTLEVINPKTAVLKFRGGNYTVGY